MAARSLPAADALGSRSGRRRNDPWPDIANPGNQGQTLATGLRLSAGEERSGIRQGSADRDEEGLVIPAFYYAHPLDDRWFVGTSLTVPSGIGNSYGNAWAGRYLAMETELAFLALQGTVAYRINDEWSVGGGPLLMYADSTTKARVRNLEPHLGDGSVKLEEDGVGAGFSLGVMFEPVEGSRFGAVYRSEIDPDLSGKPEFDELGPPLNTALELSGLDIAKIDVDFRIPAQLQNGLYTNCPIVYP